MHELVTLRKRLLQVRPLVASESVPRDAEATTAIKPVPTATPVPAPEAKTASVPAVPATPAPSSPAELPPPEPVAAPAPSAPVATVSAAPLVLPVLAVSVLPVGPLAPAATDAAPVPATPVAPVTPAIPPVPAAPAPVVAAAAVATKAALKDGTFYGWGTCRHGDIQAGIEIKGGKIVSAEIAQCLTRYSKDVISLLPHQVIERQSADVDWVSSATESSDAFFYAVSEALKQAK